MTEIDKPQYCIDCGKELKPHEKSDDGEAMCGACLAGNNPEGY